MDMLGPLQLKIMNYLWDGHAPQTAQDIADYLNERGSKHVTSTITTVLLSLEKRKLVYRQRNGHAYVYESFSGGRTEYRLAVLHYIIHDVYESHAGLLYANLSQILEPEKWATSQSHS